MAKRDFMICRPDSNGGHVVTSPDGGEEKICFSEIPQILIFILARKDPKNVYQQLCHDPCIEGLNGPLEDS